MNTEASQLADTLPQLETTLNSNHPLLEPAKQKAIQEIIGHDLSDRLTKALEQFDPHANPNLTQRLQQLEAEPNIPYLVRTLYEESFAVNPKTTGGILSHHYGSISEEKLSKLSDITQQANEHTPENIWQLSYPEGPSKIINDLENPLANQVVEHLLQLGIPRNNLIDLQLGKIPPHQRGNPETILKKTRYARHGQKGWEYLQIFTSLKPLLEQPLTDHEVLSAFNLEPQTTRNKALFSSWKKMSKLCIEKDNTFKQTNLEEPLRMLALLRSSPDLSSIYNPTHHQ